MHPFTLVFLVAVVVTLVVRLWLDRRQIRHVAGQRERVPEDFSAAIPLDRHRLAADYTIEQTRFRGVDTTVDTLLLLAWTLGGGVAVMDGLWRMLELGPVATGVGVILSMIAVSALIDLPLRAWRTFVIEARYGFNRMTPALFLGDQVRAAAVVLILGIPLSAAVLWLMRAGGPLWWLWVWLAWLVFNLAMLWAWPRFLAPLFNRFEPIDDPRLRERIDALLERCGFHADGVFVMDGSRRSSHGNAYFTGWGRNRRIVFYDTLLEQLDDAEVEAVLAHELGHFRQGHIARRIALGAVVSLAGLAVLAWLMQQPWFHFALGVPVPSAHTGLLLFLLITPIATFFLKPLLARVSRRQELEADAFAARCCPPAALASALVRLYRENASTLTPDPIYAAFHESHPPALRRLAHLHALQAGTFERKPARP